MSTVESGLRAAVAAAVPRLLAVSEPAAAEAREPGKWSAKQVIGHLIDSASNNHQRFVRAQLQSDIVFQGYDQVAWVRAQDYQAAPWPELLALWQLFNLHLARVIEAVPPATRQRPRPRHNLHELAWQPVPVDQPTTLESFVRDDLGHLEHHLEQALGVS